MTDYRPDVPRIDEACPATRLHQLCEAVAVPNFDWINQPLIAVVDGITHLRHGTGVHTVPPRD
jgi:hypothetical protein